MDSFSWIQLRSLPKFRGVLVTTLVLSCHVSENDRFSVENSYPTHIPSEIWVCFLELDCRSWGSEVKRL